MFLVHASAGYSRYVHIAVISISQFKRYNSTTLVAVPLRQCPSVRFWVASCQIPISSAPDARLPRPQRGNWLAGARQLFGHLRRAQLYRPSMSRTRLTSCVLAGPRSKYNFVRSLSAARHGCRVSFVTHDCDDCLLTLNCNSPRLLANPCETDFELRLCLHLSCRDSSPFSDLRSLVLCAHGSRWAVLCRTRGRT